MASPPEEEFFTTVAWLDPKARKMIFNPTTILIGVLAVSDASIAYATADDLIFEASRDEISVEWYPIRAGCDIRTPQRSFRLYFGQPVEGAPRLQEDQLEGVATTLAGTATAAKALGGVAGSVADLTGSVLGPIFKTVTAISDYKDGRSRFAATRTKLGG